MDKISKLQERANDSELLVSYMKCSIETFQTDETYINIEVNFNICFF